MFHQVPSPTSLSITQYTTFARLCHHQEFLKKLLLILVRYTQSNALPDNRNLYHHQVMMMVLLLLLQIMPSSGISEKTPTYRIFMMMALSTESYILSSLIVVIILI
jgi:hypothetical protein